MLFRKLLSNLQTYHEFESYSNTDMKGYEWSIMNKGEMKENLWSINNLCFIPKRFYPFMGKSRGLINNYKSIPSRLPPNKLYHN